jgi:FKBP-type peptidyl-prolyl cis-trans isomerase (trigger factor)
MVNMAKVGDIVVIELKIKYEHESVFNPPMHFKFAIGRKKAPLWLEESAIGMKPGESKTLKVPANKIIGQNLNVQSPDIIHDIKLIEIIYSRNHILNDLIKAYNFKSYLEIGIQDPENNFNYIDIENKIGVGFIA